MPLSVKASARSACRHLPLCFLAVLLLAPVLVWPDTGRWLGMRAFVMECVALALLVLLAAGIRWSPQRLKSFLTTGPNAAVLLLIGWATLSFLLTAPASGRGRSIALAELLRLACGSVVYFGAAYRCSGRAQL